MGTDGTRSIDANAAGIRSQWLPPRRWRARSGAGSQSELIGAEPGLVTELCERGPSLACPSVLDVLAEQGANRPGPCRRGLVAGTLFSRYGPSLPAPQVYERIQIRPLSGFTRSPRAPLPVPSAPLCHYVACQKRIKEEKKKRRKAGRGAPHRTILFATPPPGMGWRHSRVCYPGTKKKGPPPHLARVFVVRSLLIAPRHVADLPPP